MTAIPASPKGLTAGSRRLWRETLEIYELSPAETQVFRQALVSLDRADDAAAVLAEDGLFTTDRYGAVRAHPATDIELRHRTLFARLVAQLGVKLAEEGPVRRHGARPGRRERLAVVKGV